MCSFYLKLLFLYKRVSH